MNQNLNIEGGRQPESAFYERGSRATKIMTLANFPDEVLPLLQLESLITFEAMVYFHCDVLVELGCHDGRALEIARLLNTRYLGVDLNRHAIQKLRARIEHERMVGRADTIVDDVLNHTVRSQVPMGSRALYLLPFNLLGCFRDPTQLLKQLAALNVTAVISVFGNSLEATHVRQDYYLRCSVQELELHPLDEGTLFTGANGFYSRSYTRDSFHSLLTACGLTILRMNSSLLTHCVTVQSDAKGEGEDAN